MHTAVTRTLRQPYCRFNAGMIGVRFISSIGSSWLVYKLANLVQIAVDFFVRQANRLSFNDSIT